MIKRLAIHRFRGIREGLLEDLGKINLLIGPNNSGKTAILELLYLGGTSGRSVELIFPEIPSKGDSEATSLILPGTISIHRDFMGYSPLGRLRIRHGYSKSWKDNPVRLTEQGGIEVHLSFINERIPPALSTFTIGATLETEIRKEEVTDIALFSLNGQSGLPSALLPEWFVTKKITPESSRWHYLWDPVWLHKGQRDKPIDEIVIWAEEGDIPNPRRVLFFDFHTANAPFHEHFARNAYFNIQGWTDKIAESLGKVFPELQGTRVSIMPVANTKEGVEWTGYIEQKHTLPLPIDQFGDGARHAFKVLATLIALVESVDEEHPGLFLWEDPELFMHPATLGRLLQEVLNLIQNKPIQIFITTQSLEVLAWFAELVEKNDEFAKDIRVYTLRLQEGKLTYQKFVGRGLASWFRLFGDPRLSTEEEMASPLYYFLTGGEEYD